MRSLPRCRSLVPFVLALSLALAGCRADQVPAAADPKVVGDRISFPPDAPQLNALGTQFAAGAGARDTQLYGKLLWDEDATARVFTPFAGRVRRVLVDVGQTVAKGAPLAEVESPDFGQVQADARTAESDQKLAESTVDRLHELFAHGAVARKDVEAAEADVARAAAQQARAQARLASCGATADSVTGLFLLRCPIAGMVVERTLTPGQEIRPDQMLANAPQLFSPLFVVSDPRRLWIQIDATDGEADCLEPGAAFNFSSPALPGESFQGRIDKVAEAIDPVTHTLHARGSVENPLRRLKSEMYVQVRVPGRATAGVALPARAVLLHGDRHFVFVEERPGTYARHEVAVAAEEGPRVVVVSGVHRGDRVVTDGCVLLEQLLD